MNDHQQDSADPTLLAQAVARVRAGDVDAFAAIVAATQRDLRLTLAARCHSIDMADEVLQRTYVRAFEIINQLEQPERVRSWLFGIARRVLHEELRSRPETTLAVDALERHLAERMVDAMDDQSDLSARDERRLARMDECLERLPAHARTMIQKRYFEGLPLKTLAQHLHRSSDQLANALHRLRSKLRACIEANA